MYKYTQGEARGLTSISECCSSMDWLSAGESHSEIHCSRSVSSSWTSRHIFQVSIHPSNNFPHFFICWASCSHWFSRAVRTLVTDISSSWLGHSRGSWAYLTTSGPFSFRLLTKAFRIDVEDNGQNYSLAFVSRRYKFYMYCSKVAILKKNRILTRWSQSICIEPNS